VARLLLTIEQSTKCICHVSWFLSGRAKLNSKQTTLWHWNWLRWFKLFPTAVSRLNASEISADFSFKLLMIVAWNHCIVFTRPLGHHVPLQDLNRRQNQTNISTAPYSCRRIQGTGNDKGFVIASDSRWQHYPWGAVSFRSRSLECVDVLFIERRPGILITVLISIQDKCRCSEEAKRDKSSCFAIKRSPLG
jgi:hypothetical protein